jgi:hypothetical protein
MFYHVGVLLSLTFDCLAYNFLVVRLIVKQQSPGVASEASIGRGDAIPGQSLQLVEIYNFLREHILKLFDFFVQLTLLDLL